jgi:hypothetical protein
MVAARDVALEPRPAPGTHAAANARRAPALVLVGLEELESQLVPRRECRKACASIPGGSARHDRDRGGVRRGAGQPGVAVEAEDVLSGNGNERTRRQIGRIRCR